MKPKPNLNKLFKDGTVNKEGLFRHSFHQSQNANLLHFYSNKDSESNQFTVQLLGM